MFWSLVYSSLAWREPEGIPLEMYSPATYASKIDGMSPLLIVAACHVPGFARSLSVLVDTFQNAAQYIAAYPGFYVDYGILYEESESEEVYVTIHSPNITDVPLTITENTLPKILAFEMLQQIYNNYKTIKKKLSDEQNPEIVNILEQIKLQEKLIRTAVDKADARMNQAKKEELMEKLKGFIPPDKLERNRLRSDIKACTNPTEKAELEAKLEELKAKKDTSNYTKLDTITKAAHDAAKEIAKFAAELDRENELKELKKYREEMIRMQEENDYGEEEDSMSQIYQAAAQVADNEKDRAEYADKADKFGKLKKLKLEHKLNMTRERKEKLRKEKLAKRRAEIGGDDNIQIPDEELLSDSDVEDADFNETDVDDTVHEDPSLNNREDVEFEENKPKENKSSEEKQKEEEKPKEEKSESKEEEKPKEEQSQKEEEKSKEESSTEDNNMKQEL